MGIVKLKGGSPIAFLGPVQKEGAAVRDGDFSRNVQAQPGASSEFTGLHATKKPVEDPRLLARGNGSAAIPYANRNRFIRAFDRYRDLGVWPRVLTGIVQQLT